MHSSKVVKEEILTDLNSRLLRRLRDYDLSHFSYSLEIEDELNESCWKIKELLSFSFRVRVIILLNGNPIEIESIRGQSRKIIEACVAETRYKFKVAKVPVSITLS